MADAENPYLEDPPTDFEPVESLTEDEANEQAAQLREAIREHDRRYYVEQDPVIADRTYDALFARLEDLEEYFDLDTEDSPTNRVGGEPVDEFPTVEHVAPMLSIDQSGEEAEVRAFDDRVRREVGSVTYVCEPKFDGVSLEVVYEDGQLQQAVTRGDGYEGDDVTSNALTIPTIPQRLSGDPPSELSIRGELYMPRDGFQAYNRELVERGEEPFANPRNATAGTIRQQDPTVVAERPLAFVAFEVLDTSDPWPSRWAEHEAFPELGIPVSDRVERVDSIDDAIEYRDWLVATRDDLDYEVDGAVIKVDDREAQRALGSTSRHPRWAFAYKFPPRTEETTIRDIVLQIGRTGRATPVALMDPVDVGGVTVSRASLHNPDQIAELGVGIGDRVRIERAGDVIPQVVESDDGDGHFEYPETCPVCGEELEREGPIARCPAGLDCPAQRRRGIQHYASRGALDIEGLGAETVDLLVEEGLVETLANLYELELEELAALEGFGERAAEKLVAAIDDAREPALADFVTALGIPEVGGTTARTLALEFGNIEALEDASREELQSVEDVGPVVAGRIRDFFDAEANRRVLDDLLEHVDPQAPDVEDAGDAFDGETIVFTGSLPTLTRQEASDQIELQGGNVTSSVSSNTDYLVVGENPGTRKREDADENDVPELSGEAFEERLETTE